MRFDLELPAWATSMTDPGRRYESDRERMALAIELARSNVQRKTGGPFGAAVFERDTGELAGIGMNLVLALNNSVLHAEVIALMLAERKLGRFDLGAGFEVVTSCEPCAMCLGAIHWSGAGRLVIGARRSDAERIKFDEGPVFPASYEYLEARGLEVVRDVGRDDAIQVLEEYARSNGVIY
jgi:tRNA(Arg) A34 adenosine deaminase TadA